MTAQRRRRRKRLRIQPRFIVVLLLFLVVVVLAVVVLSSLGGTDEGQQQAQNGQNPSSGGLVTDLFNTSTPTPEPTPEPTPTPRFDIPHAVDSSNPANWGYSTDVEVNGTVVQSYTRQTPIFFDYDEPYTNVNGIVTFRGDHYRSGAAYGTASISSKSLSKAWSFEIGQLAKPSGSGNWSGSGWVGQPLVVCWPDSTKQIMNMYDWAKQKQGLVEGILACLDGNVYFFDIESGEATRPVLQIGIPFKGAGSLDPRGYPILYLGSGDNYPEDPSKTVRAVAYSLVDFSCLYTFGAYKDSFAIRDWHAYDSAPLVDAATDTLIYPGENGILYTIKLNTAYNEQAGTLTMAPSETVKFRYNTSRSSAGSTSADKYWMGYEDSAVMWGEYVYLVTNDGYMQCININTMELIWAQDVLDDTNATIVLEEDEANRTAYLYVGTSLHFTKDENDYGTTPLFKINAVTGEIVWRFDVNVYTRSGVSGGVQATAVVGKNSISDLVIVPFARVPDVDHGYLMAIDKNTGTERWRFAMDGYSWSSPVAVYDANGSAYIVSCDSTGRIYLLDGKTGTKLSVFDAERNIEASPVVYGNTIIVGTRGMDVYGVHIS